MVPFCDFFLHKNLPGEIGQPVSREKSLIKVQPPKVKKGLVKTVDGRVKTYLPPFFKKGVSSENRLVGFPAIHTGEKEIYIHFCELLEDSYSSLLARTRISIDIDNELFPMIHLHIGKTPSDKLTLDMVTMVKLKQVLQKDCLCPDPSSVKFSINITTQDVLRSRGLLLCVNDTHVLV